VINRDHVVWAYRLLLDRDPESEQAIEPKLRAWRTTRELRTDIMASEEFRLKNPDVAAAGGRSLVIKPIGDARLWIDLGDHVIGLAILRDRYESDAVRLATSLVKPGDTAVDVGAHVGFFAIQLAAAVGPGGRVYAFEPLAANAALLERSIAENDFGDRVVLERAAVADVAGTVTLRYARETLNSGGAFVEAAESEQSEGLVREPVRAVRLDDVDLRRPVRLIKMDVEGAEPRVLRGARRLIARDRPVVITEVHPDQLRRVSGVTPEAFLAESAALGYRARRIVDGGIGSDVAVEDVTAVTTIVLQPR
jgi:FkbM family methyltransferase